MEYVLLFAIFLAFIFYQLRSAETNTLLAILVVCVLAAAAHAYARAAVAPSAPEEPERNARKEAVSSQWPVKAFHKMKHVATNERLMDIAKDVRFVRMFDKSRYGDMLLHMDHMQKIYMYILAKRYDPVTYVPLFMDMRRAVLEIMYSFIHIVPERLKHTYGIRPYEVIEKNIRDFTALSRTMSVILGAFAKDNGAVLPDSYFDAYEPSRENVLP